MNVCDFEVVVEAGPGELLVWREVGVVGADWCSKVEAEVVVVDLLTRSAGAGGEVDDRPKAFLQVDLEVRSG